MVIADESSKGLLRDAITRIYYKYRKRQAIPIHEWENVEHLYAVYREYKANTYVSEIMKIMRTWQVLSGEDVPQQYTQPAHPDR